MNTTIQYILKLSRVISLGLITLFCLASTVRVSGQTTVNSSVFWTTGWCTICNTINGGQYACASGSGSPQWNNGQRNFTDPVPTGNNVTQFCATVNYVCCGLTSITVRLNGTTVGTFAVPGGCNCNCGNCYSGTICFTPPAGVYNYGGQNTVQVVNNGGNICVNSVQMAITYQQACNVPISNNNIAANQSICSTQLPAMLSGSTPGGGNGIYAYQWLSSSNNSTWGQIPGATNVTYSPGALGSTLYFRRRVFSQPGCVDTSAAISVYIENPILSNTVGNNQTICAAGTPNLFTGSIPTGGSGSYSYSWESSTNNVNWSPLPGGTGLNFQSGQIGVTTYFRRVVTAGICPPNNSNSIQIDLLPQLGDNQIGNNQTICTGTQPANITGSIPTGGSGAFNFTWQSSTDNLNWNTILGGVAPAYQPPVITVGTYFRRIVTSPPCTDTSNVVFVNVNEVLGNNLIINDQTICIGVNPAVLTGSVSTGGSGNPSFTWQSSPDGVTWNPVPGGNQIDFGPPQTAGVIYYRRIVSDGPCPATTSNTVTIQVDQIISANTIGNDQTVCDGSQPLAFTGSIPNGGNGTYTYSWESSPDNNVWIGIGGSNTQGYGPGVLNSTTYYRRIVSSGTCVASTSASVMVQVDPAIGNNVLSSSQTICDGDTPAPFNGTNPSGGSSIYSYSWESSSDNIAWVTLPGVTTSGYAEGILNANAYYRRLVNSGVCSPSTSDAVSVLVNLIPTVNVTNAVICFGQTATITANGNPAGGTYVWTSGQVTQTIDVNPSTTTTYTVVYTLNNCPSLPGDGVVTVNTPVRPNIIASGPLDLCPNTTVNLTSDPGVNYVWSHDNSLNQQTVSIGNTGTYTVTVTDVNGCISTSLPVSITVHTNPILTVSSSPARCFGEPSGSGFAEALNGTQPYTFTWNTVPVQTGQNANNILAGTYIVTVTDIYGCTDNSNVIVDQPPQLLMVANLDNAVSCAGGSDAVATALVVGGIPPYTYAWATNPVQTTQTVTGLAAGNVTVNVTDQNGCISSDALQVTQPNPITISPNVNPVRCYGESNGSITAVVSGGTPGYFYSWNTNPVQTTPTAINLMRGAYQVSITDGNGCTGSASFNVSQPDSLVVRVNSTDARCAQEPSGSSTAIVTGGNGNYGYRWNTVPQQQTQTAINLPAGIYVVTAFDPNGCVDTARAYIGQPEPLPFPIALHDTLCPGEDAVLSAYAPGEGLKINWYRTPGDQIPVHTGTKYILPSPSQTVFMQIEAEDSKGCKTPRFPIFAWVNTPPIVGFTVDREKADVPDAIFNFSPARTMDIPAIYSWAWQFGDGQTSQYATPTHQYSSEGFYDVTLTVVDTNGCMNSTKRNAFVEVTKYVNVVVPNAFSPNGDGANDYFWLEYRMIREFEIIIYDRWSNQIYTSNDPAFRWDGTVNGQPAPEGVYVYVIKGKTVDDTAVQLGGNVILMR